MMWQAFAERGIPGAIYRPGMVSGLSDGTYHKLDEFLPQFLKGCIQLGAWPLLDTTWEMAPVDFTSKAIVHIAKRPQNLNQAYFVVHPRSRQVSDYIDWHREVGYDIRGLPWDVWKRELLGLGTEGLRKNALFPFVDFIRALSEEQVFFPPTGRALFDSATADLDSDVPDQLELLARYTRHFVACDYYDQLPSNPRAGVSDEPALVLHPRENPGRLWMIACASMASSWISSRPITSSSTIRCGASALWRATCCTTAFWSPTNSRRCGLRSATASARVRSWPSASVIH